MQSLTDLYQLYKCSFNVFLPSEKKKIIIPVCESHMSVLNFEPCPTWCTVKQMLYIIGGPVIHMFYLTKCTTPMSNEVTCNKNISIILLHCTSINII